MLADLMGRLGGQLRVGLSGVVGFDLAVAFTLGRALGLSDLVMAEVLPPMEAAAMAAMRKLAKERSGNG